MKKFDIIVVEIDDREYVGQCQFILLNNRLLSRPMTDRLASFSEYVVCAVQGDRVLGFLNLFKDGFNEEILYIEHLAVEPSLSNDKEIKNSLLDYAKTHSLGYEKIVSVLPRMEISLGRMLVEKGFEREERKYNTYQYTLKTKKIKENQHMEYTDLDNYNENE